MYKCYSWIYIDSTNNVWRFYKKENHNFCYKIMYDDGKWTKERTIDKEIREAYVYVEDEMIHIVYITLENKLKYCIMKDKQWLGRTLYEAEEAVFELQNLKVEIIGSKMHIFFLQLEKSNKKQATLMQFLWEGDETRTEKLKTLVLDRDLEENYLIEVDKKGELYLLFTTYEGDEFGLNVISYENNMWTSEKRLYSIKGEEITFKCFVENQVLHIINKYKEDSVYYLDYVCVEKNGAIYEARVHESSIEPNEPILGKKEDNLYTFWLEENKIFYALFDGECWGQPIYCKYMAEEMVEKYHFYGEYSKEVKEKEIYGTGELDMCLFLPYQFLMNMKEDEITKDNTVVVTDLHVPRKKESLQTYKMELIRLKSENRDLNSRNVSLTMQLQKKKRELEVQEERLKRILEQKQNTEEHVNVYLKLHEEAQNDLDLRKQQLLQAETLRTEMEEECKKYEEQIAVLREKNEVLRRANEELMQENEELRKSNEELGQVNEELRQSNEELRQSNEELGQANEELGQSYGALKQENETIRQENEAIKMEKEQLMVEMEAKKNRSLFERLMKGKNIE